MKTENPEIVFTPQQLADWKAFEKVRSGGKWNMFDPRARGSSGLSEEAYSFVMKHFSALKATVEAQGK